MLRMGFKISTRITLLWKKLSTFTMINLFDKGYWGDLKGIEVFPAKRSQKYFKGIFLSDIRRYMSGKFPILSLSKF